MNAYEWTHLNTLVRLRTPPDAVYEYRVLVINDGNPAVVVTSEWCGTEFDAAEQAMREAKEMEI